MKTCDVCNRNIGLIRFRYRDGSVCRECYERASRNCTETIRGMDLNELKARCGQDEGRLDFGDFEITDRIGNYVLIDGKQKKICIVNNRLQVKEYRRPEIIALEDIRYCRIVCNASLGWEELKGAGEMQGAGRQQNVGNAKNAGRQQNVGNAKNAGNSQKGYAAALGLELFLGSAADPRQIQILSSPIRIKSFAFRKSMDFMQLIVGYLESNGVECGCEQSDTRR